MTDERINGLRDWADNPARGSATRANILECLDEIERLRSLLVNVRASVEASTDADMHLTAATIDAGLAL